MYKNFVFLFCLISVSIFAQDKKAEEKDTIEQVIIEAFDALFNNGDESILQSHFHPGFEFYFPQYNSIRKEPIYDWINRVKWEKKEGYIPPKELVSLKFKWIEAVEGAAVACFDYYRGERHTCTDFLTLYKFEEGWRIVGGITHHWED
jgi:hypothetical protein